MGLFSVTPQVATAASHVASFPRPPWYMGLRGPAEGGSSPCPSSSDPSCLSANLAVCHLPISTLQQSGLHLVTVWPKVYMVWPVPQDMCARLPRPGASELC